MPPSAMVMGFEAKVPTVVSTGVLVAITSLSPSRMLRWPEGVPKLENWLVRNTRCLTLASTVEVVALVLLVLLFPPQAVSKRRPAAAHIPSDRFKRRTPWKISAL